MVFIHNLLLILGRGIGQVMFQNNALSGLFMLIGIFLNSWQMGILAVCGNIISTLTAHFSGYKYDDIKNGLYGFNGTLVGIAVGVFLQLSVGSLIMLIIASALSTWIAYFFNQQRLIPGFTAPFLLYGECWEFAAGLYQIYYQFPIRLLIPHRILIISKPSV